MLRQLFFLLMITATAPSFSQSTLPINEVREKYFYNNHHTCYVLDILKAFKSNTPKNPVLIAYYGAASAAAPRCGAKHLEKIKLFNKGKTLLEEAIRLSPNDFEVRFLRFATQVKAPRFLGYNDNIDEDKKFLVKNLEAGKSQFKGSPHFNQVIKFMLYSKELDQSEKQTVNSYL